MPCDFLKNIVNKRNFILHISLTARVGFKTTKKSSQVAKGIKGNSEEDRFFSHFFQWGANQIRLLYLLKPLIFPFFWIYMHTYSQKHELILPQTFVKLFRCLISKQKEL